MYTTLLREICSRNVHRRPPTKKTAHQRLITDLPIHTPSPDGRLFGVFPYRTGIAPATPSSLVTSPRPSYSFPGRNDAPVPTVTDIGMPQTTGAFHATANRKVALGVERYTAACLVQQQPTPSCGSPSAPKTSPQSYLTLTAVNGSSTSVKSSGRHPYSYDFLRSRVMMWAGNTIGKLNVER